MPIGGYPLAMYGMAALTTAVLAYATISGSGSPASVESTAEKSGEGMLSGLFGSNKSEGASSSEEGSKGGVMESLGNMVSGSPDSSPSPASITTGGSRHKKKHRKTKNKRAKRRSEKTKSDR